MSSTITLITSTGAIVVKGEGLVIDLTGGVDPRLDTLAHSEMPAASHPIQRHVDADEVTPPASSAPITRPAVSAGADGHRSIPRTDARAAGPDEAPALSVITAQSVHAVSNSHSTGATVETGRAGGPRRAPVAHFTKKLRSHCLRPELCASGTRDHCFSCKKAMAESEAA